MGPSVAALGLLLWAFSTSVAADSTRIRLCNGTLITLWNPKDDLGTRFGCDHTRASVASCIRNYVDTNHDDGVTEQEIDAAKSKYMHWHERLFDGIVSAGTSKEIRQRCDLNSNGKIDYDDLIAWHRRCSVFRSDAEVSADTHKSCLCNCESIDSISKYICDRARAS